MGRIRKKETRIDANLGRFGFASPSDSQVLRIRKSFGFASPSALLVASRPCSSLRADSALLQKSKTPLTFGAEFQRRSDFWSRIKNV